MVRHISCPICKQQAELNTPCPTCEFENRVFATTEDTDNWLQTVAKPHKRYYELQQSYTQLHAEHQETKKQINTISKETKKQSEETKNQIAAIIKRLDEKPKAEPPKPKPKVGSTIPFGGYNWRVLDIQGGQALLLSDLVLEFRAYHKDLKDITWENCTLRQYLNNDFYNKLPDTDKNRIAQRSISNHDNPWFATKGGNNTLDRIFLLSIEEVVKYLGDGSLERPKMSADEKKFWDVDVFENNGVSDWLKENGYPELSFRIDFHGNTKRVARDSNGKACWWWLRSPGTLSFDAANVYGVGCVDFDGNYVYNASGGVRPALWLNL
ncbi:MAG: DUF6273 domain-containing protein [Defluviitaleaceae bacterium]|nr:DUF6273 domain-containing protein [Defluviitaleaceae bacterium]